jgi:hypothetical protein
MIRRSVREAARRAVRPRGAIGHAGLAEDPVAVGPPRRGGVRHLEPLGRSAQRSAVVDHAASEP